MFAMMSVRMGREEGRGGRNGKGATEEGTREREKERSECFWILGISIKDRMHDLRRGMNHLLVYEIRH